jgi:hypothetical protein
MRETFAGVAPAGAAVATGYLLSNGNTPQNPGDASWYYACGDILSTSEDLARFDIALMDGTLLSEKTFVAMSDAARPTGEGSIGYGLGVMTFPYGSKLLVGHHGGLPGFEGGDEMIASDRFAVVTLGNDFLYPTGIALASALQAFYPGELAAAKAQASAAKAAAETEDPKLTARFYAFLQGLIAGKVDERQLTDAMRNALSPAVIANTAQFYSRNGTLLKLQFVSGDQQGPYHRYQYLAVFGGAKKPILFVLDGEAKLAGIANL